MKYIQMNYYGKLETVDQFETYKEAKELLKEYQRIGGGCYYISSRACRGWK